MREFGLRWRGYRVSRTIKLFNDNGFVLTFHPVNRFTEIRTEYFVEICTGSRFSILKFSLSINRRSTVERPIALPNLKDFRDETYICRYVDRKYFRRSLDRVIN